jgi:outer membrane protein assembly factor BamB
MRDSLQQGLFLWVAFVFMGCLSARLERPIKIQEADWTVFGGNPQHTNERSVALEPPLELAWEYDASAGFGPGSPVAADSFVFIGTLNGDVHIVHSTTGNSAGKFSVESAVAGALLIDGTNIIAGSASGDRTLACYDYRDGFLRWTKELGDIESSPLRYAHKLLVTTLGGTLYCLEKSDGSEIWRFETKQPIHSSPATDGRVVVFGCDDAFLYGVEIETGKLLWRYKTGGSIFATPSIYRDRVYVGSLDNNFYAINLQDGSLLWKFGVGAKIYGAPSFTEDRVFFGATNGTLYALSARDGSLAWRFNAGSIINSSPIVAGGTIYFGSLDKKVYGLDTATGELKWDYDVKGRVKTSPIVWRNYLIVAAEDRSVFAFQPTGKGHIPTPQ